MTNISSGHYDGCLDRMKAVESPGYHLHAHLNNGLMLSTINRTLMGPEAKMAECLINDTCFSQVVRLRISSFPDQRNDTELADVWNRLSILGADRSGWKEKVKTVSMKKRISEKQ